MEFIADLWLPILLSAVFIFIVSGIFHMLLPFHKRDYRKLPDENGTRLVLRDQDLEPGMYCIPCGECMKDMASPEMMAKYKEGPVGFLTMLPNGPPNMNKCLVQWFIYTLVISIFVGYLANLTLGPGADYMRVFRITGTIAVLAYGVTAIQESIWKGQLWSSTLKFVFDGVVYGLVTAGTFGWLWPGAGQ